jgi:hypothetical protein
LDTVSKKLDMMAKSKPAETRPTLAVLENPPSSDPQRVVVRIQGISYSLPSAASAEAFKAKYGRHRHHDEG